MESHLKMIGLIKTEEISEHQQKIMDEKRAQFEAEKQVKATVAAAPAADAEEASAFPAGAQLCNKCNTKASIQMDGCMTCLNCGDSKCG